MSRSSVNQYPCTAALYPFVAASTLSEPIQDFYLAYQDDYGVYARPFTLSLANNVLSVLDANGATVASGSLATATIVAWGMRTVYEWLGSSWVMRMVIGDLLAAGTGQLDARTLNRLPARVRSLRVGAQVFTGKVRFQAGYNISLAGISPARVDGGRFVNQVALDCVVGAGAGQAPGCQETQPVLRHINAISPDDHGNFLIQVDPGCLRGQIDGHGLEFFSDCHPCYDCSYFVRTYMGVKHVYNQWHDASSEAEQARDTYEANRNRWLDQLQCRFENPGRLVAAGGQACKSFVGGLYCNVTHSCLSPVEMRYTMQLYKGGVEQAWPASPAIYDAYLNGSQTEGDQAVAVALTGPVAILTADYANPRESTTTKFHICLAGCTSDESLRITLTVHVPDPPPAPGTGEVTTLPVASVPTEIQNIWTHYGIPTPQPARLLLQQTVPLDATKETFPCSGGC